MRELGGAEVGLPAHRLVDVDRPLAGRAEDGEPVVLRGDLDAAGREVLDRVVGAAVPERELEGLEADRPAQELVAEADAERRAPADEVAQRGDDVVERRRVAGAVGQEDRVGLAGQQVLGARAARVQLQPHATAQQVAHDRALDAGVDRHDARAVVAVAEQDGLARRDLARQVETGHRRLRVDALARLGLGCGAREDAAAHRAGVADVAHQRARVDTGDARDAAVAQPVQPAALRARRVLAVDRRAHDQPARVDRVGLHRLGRDPVVADVRVGEGDDLAAVAGVGDRLLVARHRRVEDDLAGHGARRAARLAVEARAVLEEHVGGHAQAALRANARSRYATAPAATVSRTRPVSVRPA